VVVVLLLLVIQQVFKVLNLHLDLHHPHLHQLTY
jgi:hypothetical protein